MADLFTEEETDLLEEPGRVRVADIPNFEPTKLTLEDQPEPEPFSTEKLAEPVEVPGEITATRATTFAPPKAEPVYDISLAPTPAPTPITPYVEPPVIDKGKEFSDDWFTKAYTDDTFLAQQASDPAFRELERTSINPQGFRLRSLNRAWLERETGQTFGSDVEFDAARNEWSEQHDVKPVRSDQEFAANRKTDYQRTVELQAASVDMIGRGVVQATVDYAAGRPTQMQYLLDDLKKKYPALSDPEIETRATIALRNVASEVKKIIDPLRPQISEAMPLVERLARDPSSTEDLIGLSRIVKSVGFEKGAQLLELVSAGYHAYDPEGKTKDQLFTAIENVRKSLVIENLGFATSGSITQQEDQIEESLRLLAQGHGYIGDDGRIRFQRTEQLPGAPTPQGRLLTGEEVAVHLEKGKEALDLIRASRMVRDALTHKIDPIQPIFTGMAGDAERGVYTALSSTAFSIGGGLAPRGIGDGFWWWGTREMELNDLLVKNPGLGRNAAKEIAGWSATYQAPFNRLQGEILFNRFIGVKGIVRDLAGGKILAAGAKLGIDTGVEFINENFQNFGSNFTQRFGDLVASEREAASGVTMDEWKPLSQKAWKDTVSQMPDTFWGILPMMLIGAGVNLVTDPGITQEELIKGFSWEGLLAQGLSEEQAARVIAKGDFESMAKQLVIEHPRRTPENMARANAEGAAAQAQQQTEAERHINDEATPSWTQRTMPDGTIEYTVRDPEGNVVRTTMNRAVFEATLNEEFEMAASETLVRKEQQQVSEEAAAKAAESEATIAALPPEEQAQARMSPSAVLDFEPSEQPPTPEQQAKVDALNAALGKAGFPEAVRAVAPLPVQRTPAGRLAASFIQGFQHYTGRAVQFIASESGEPLPYRGVVNPADPNTIFLDAAGDRAFLALLGHEWSHTLKGTNPKLYAAFIEAARPLVAEWQAEQARISERAGGKYKPEQLTDELVANIIGDAFAHPEFLKRLAQRNPGAFEGLVNFIKEWFAKFIDAATHSTWGTEALISDINAMHDLIIDTMEQARVGPEVAAAPAEGVAFALRSEPEVSEFEMQIQRGVREVAAIGHYSEEERTKVRNDIVARIAKKGQFLAVRAKDSVGMYKKERERTLDTEILTGPNIEPMDILRIAATHAWTEHQKSTFVARVIKDWEKDNLNARPGLEIYFDRKLTPEEVQPIMDYLEARKINGFTAVIDQRAKPNPMPGAGEPDFLYGVRFMYIPEYNDKKRERDDWDAEAAEIQEVLRASYAEIAKIPGVRSVLMAQYDTVVLKTGEDYDERGVIETSAGREFAEGWRERFLHANATPATSQPTVFQGQGIGPSPVPGRGEEPARGPPGEPGEGVAFSLREGKKAQARAEAPLEREASLQAIFERIHAAPAKRADLVRRAARAFAEVRARHVQQLAEFAPPGVPDEQAGLAEIEAQETLALEDVDAEEQAALDQNTLNVADRYGDRILAEQDVTKRRALERQQKLLEAAQRKGIEARFDERRKGVAREFTLRRQALRAEVEQATHAATAEGAAELRRLKQVQTYAELNAILKSMPADIRGRIPPTPNLAGMSDEQLTDFLVKRITQISSVMEFVQKRSFQEAITELLTRFKPKKSQAGVIKSRIGADAQDVVTRVSAYLKMDGAAVQAESDGIERQLSQGGLTPEQESALIMRQNELETFGAMKEMSAAELEAALNELKATIQAGRASWGASEEARLADMHAKAEEVKRVLPAATAPGAAAKNRKILTNLLANFARNHTSFIQVLGRIFPDADFVPQWESDAIKRDSADMDFVRATQDRLIEAIGAALGTKSVVKIGSALRAMDVQNIPVLGGVANKREAIQYLFAWGQPKVQERMRGRDWTDEHIRVLQEATMDPASQALMAFFQREYEAIYQRANVVYRKLYGMNLPRIEGTYAPMRYHGAGGPAELTPTGAVVSSGVTPSAIKGRVAHDARLRQVDSLQVFSEHLYQMSHWIHFAEFIRETRGVMNNPEVKLALEQSIGARGITDLQKQLDAVTRNGITRSSEVSGINDVINHITKGVAVGGLAFNMHSAAVQGDSALRWMTAIPIQRWHKAFLNHRWIAAIPTAWHSDTVQRRVMQGTNPAVRLAMERDNLTPSLLLKLVDIGFWHLNYFDGAATAVSSAIVYADAIEQGMTHEQATQKMDEAVARFSQPIAITSKTQALATGGASQKMLLMFMADPMLKTSLTMEGLMNISRSVRNKDVSLLEKGIRNIVSVEVWSLVSQFILNAWSHLSGDDEDEDDIWVFRHWLRAALVAPFQGFFVAGNIAEGLARAAFGEKWYLGQPASVRFVEDIRKTATHYEDLLSLDPLDPEFQKELSNIVKVGGVAFGGGWAAGAAAITRGATAVQAAKEKLEE